MKKDPEACKTGAMSDDDKLSDQEPQPARPTTASSADPASGGEHSPPEQTLGETARRSGTAREQTPNEPQPGTAAQQSSAVAADQEEHFSPQQTRSESTQPSGLTPEPRPERATGTQNPVQLSPLSIQAAALVKSIDGLSTIFWISFGGTFLSIFFAGLNQLDVNATTDYIFLGEYQVPKSMLPLAAVAFAVFVFWLTANRLKILEQVLDTAELPAGTVHEIFSLNPPVLHVFHIDNVKTWSPTCGVSVFIINWAVFFGNSMALTWSSALQQGAYLGQFDLPLLVIYLLLIIAAIVYGTRSIIPPLRGILSALHGVELRLGWRRHALAIALAATVFITNHWNQIQAPTEQANNLLGPAIANAIDGETLFMRGTEVKLFGIDAMEDDQVCQDATGADYPCGRRATQALQSLVKEQMVICLPFFSIGERRVVANCEVVWDSASIPVSPIEFMEEFRPTNLSRLMVAEGHAVAIGIGARFLDTDQNEAQRLRQGIWQGSFQPPSAWRRRAGQP